MYLTNSDFVKDNKELISLLKTKKIIDNNDRVNYSRNYIKNKKVLNIWCLNHTITSYNKQHEEIVSIWGFVIWVDIQEEAKKIWDNIEIWDITDKEFINKLNKKYGKFEVIFAWELIEHLDNYKLFFLRLYDLLEDNWVIIISTPNPFWLHYFKEVFFKWILPMWNTDHKYRIDIIQLVFNIKEYFHLIDYVHVNPLKSIEQKIIYILGKPQLAMNYLAIFKKICK